MAFMKDPDAHTRGVNAVAAFDRSGRGPALQRLKIRKMQRRDRALAAAARGALRGMGAIDANKLGAGGGRRPVISPGGGNVESPSGGLVGQVGSGRTPTVIGPKGSPGSMPYAYPAPPGPRMAKGMLVIDPMVATPPRAPRQPPGSRAVPTALTPAGTRPVAPLPTPSSDEIRVPVTPVIVGGGSSGGGGGGGSSGGGGGAAYPDDLVESSPIPDTSSPLKTALLIGGGLFAAYLIFGKDD